RQLRSDVRKYLLFCGAGTPCALIITVSCRRLVYLHFILVFTGQCMSNTPHTHLMAGAGQSSRSTAYSPLYKQIKGLLLNSLDQGEWKPGQVIPSEMDLAARFQVSQGTVRKAIDELAADNLLVRRQGKGTFVATHHEARVRFRFLRLSS